MNRITLSLLFCFVTVAVVDAQELSFPEEGAANLSQGFDPSGQEFGDENFELAEGESFTMTSYSESSQTGSAVPSADPRSRSSMLGGFVQFLMLMAVAGVTLIGWIVYRNKQAERNEYMQDRWG